MENINISFLRGKLYKYGITFENFQMQTGNLIGKVIVPSILRAYNKNLTAEEAFYFVANKVFESANLLAFGIPVRLGEDYERIVSYDDYKDFQKAIYEEVNQRFLSNSFPEFQNAGSVSISNVNIQNGYLGGQLITEWINPVSRQIIANIDWRKYEDVALLNRDKVYMYRSMDNAWLPTSKNKRVILALEDGSIGLVEQEEFAKQSDLLLASQTIRENFELNANQKTEINNIKKQCETFATKEFVNQVATAFPECERWNPDKTYQIPAFVEHGGSIYWNEINDNINNVPGGISGENKWKKVNDVFVSSKKTDLIYKPATDFKCSPTNPNFLYYVNINDLLAIDDLNETTLFNFLDRTFPHLNLTLEESNEFFNNLCNCSKEKLHKLYGRKIKLAKDIIIPFDDQISMNEYITSNSLTNDDYEIINNQKYLRFANNQTLLKEGGSNSIKQTDLPNIYWNLEVHSAGGGWSNDCQCAGSDWTGNSNSNGLNQSLEKQNYYAHQSSPGPDGGAYNYMEGFRWKINLNGNVEQTKFEPEFYSVYAIKIKRNIYYDQQNIFTNVCKMSLEGKLIKTNDEPTKDLPNDNNYLYFVKQKDDSSTFTSYSIKSLEKNVVNVPETTTIKNFINNQINNSKNDLINKINKLPNKAGNRISIQNNTISVIEKEPINITNEETYAGYNYFGKPVYVIGFQRIPHGRTPIDYLNIETVVDFRAFSKYDSICIRSNDTAHSGSGVEVSIAIENFNSKKMWVLYNDGGSTDNWITFWYTKKDKGGQ